MSMDSISNWNLEVLLVFYERGKPEYPEKNLTGQGREPITNSTHMWLQRRDLNLGRSHWWVEASTLTTAPPLLPLKQVFNHSYMHLHFLNDQ